MAKTNSDLILEASLSIETLKVEVALRREVLQEVVARRRVLETDMVALRLEIAHLRGEHVALARELADWRRRSEVWSQRWWGLAVAVTAATFVALLRRFV